MVGTRLRSATKCTLPEEVMEFEQLVKRLEWLDEEHRKTRSSIVKLEERMNALDGKIDTLAKQLKPLPQQIAEIATTTARFDQFDAIFAKQREDMNRAIDDIEKRHQKREKEVTSRHQQDFEPILKSIAELKQTLDAEFPPNQRDIKACIVEDTACRKKSRNCAADRRAKRVAEKPSCATRFDESANRKQALANCRRNPACPAIRKLNQATHSKRGTGSPQGFYSNRGNPQNLLHDSFPWGGGFKNGEFFLKKTNIHESR